MALVTNSSVFRVIYAKTVQNYNDANKKAGDVYFVEAIKKIRVQLNDINALPGVAGTDYVDYGVSATELGAYLPKAGGMMDAGSSIGFASSLQGEAMIGINGAKFRIDTDGAVDTITATANKFEMNATLDMKNKQIQNLASPSLANDAANKTYVDTQRDTRLSLGGGTMTGPINMGTKNITNLADPVNDQDAVTKKWITSKLGANSGIATLDATGRVPSAQLPSFVDDVIEVATYANLPKQTDDPGPEAGKIYVTKDTNVIYRWTGTGDNYAEISASLALGTTSSTAFPGDRGLTAESNASAALTHANTINGNIHGSTTVGANLLRAANPGAISFIRINANNSVTMRSAADFKIDLSLNNVKNYEIANKGEAELGTSNLKYMTPLRVAEAITALAPAAIKWTVL